MQHATAKRLAPGDVVSEKYSIVNVLGEGGMGTVYLAEHRLLGEHVAIKTIHTELLVDDSIVTRFINEAKAAARLRTEHVVRIFDVGVCPRSGPFMVMDLLEGQTVEDMLEARGPLSAREAADLLLPVLEGLAMAHAAGIVHRDLKPANFFLAKGPAGRIIIKILDFGIAKGADANASVTSTHAMMGSPLYMSPEQAKSARRAEARSDLWSIGVILYELVTKEVPFTGESVGEVLAAILSDEPVNVRVHAPALPAELAELIHGGLLVKSLDARLPSALALAERLAPFASAEVASYVERVREASMPTSSKRMLGAARVEPASLELALGATSAVSEPESSRTVADTPVARGLSEPDPRRSADVAEPVVPRPPGPAAPGRPAQQIEKSGSPGFVVGVGALAVLSIVGAAAFFTMRSSTPLVAAASGAAASAAASAASAAPTPSATTSSIATVTTPVASETAARPASETVAPPPTPSGASAAGSARRTTATGKRTPQAPSSTTAAAAPAPAPSGLSSTRQTW